MSRLLAWIRRNTPPALSTASLTIRLMALGHLAATHLVSASATEGPSMLPTLEVHRDWVLISHLHARNGARLLAVGDLVSFDNPSEPGAQGIKRIIGLAGDYVSIGMPQEDGEGRTIQVPKGHCWVVGDNVEVSRDSRHFGPLPLALVTGKVLAKVLPWDERKWLRNTLQPIDEI